MFQIWVSIPYRYSTNRRRRSVSHMGDYRVSIPYRYSTNNRRNGKRDRLAQVSIPYRYSTNLKNSVRGKA